ncbi:SHOCT domain-containing protein [Alkalihalobacillus oceani]|uniref:SHOCT domain-containing protein n=1 Tax=Halalkalibacter oceani TaxID=1653776 RepID=A0A9X2DT54_9BACI|nr:SHOCT domain-containing protein [Halalkalibacter oceani]MCM3716589.1 SHOCT domain-containing protein [Halalkalibacter oceani]
MNFLGYVVVAITAICLYFLTVKRFKKGPNISRVFYVLSIISFYIGLFKSPAISVFVALIDAVIAGIFWFIIGLLFEHFSNRKQRRSPLIPVADEIEKLAKLKEKGIISEEEFRKQKDNLLSN